MPLRVTTCLDNILLYNHCKLRVDLLRGEYPLAPTDFLLSTLQQVFNTLQDKALNQCTGQYYHFLTVIETMQVMCSVSSTFTNWKQNTNVTNSQNFHEESG